MLIRLIDFENYFHAAQMIWHGQSPYGVIEFFAPPWLALFIAPLLVLSINTASIAWLFVSISSIYGAVLLSVRWVVSSPSRHWQLAVPFLVSAAIPIALFTYITGQISALVGFAALLVSWEVSTGQFNTPLIVAGILVSTLKPHIVVFPLTLCVLELIRLRKYRAVIYCLAGLAAVILFAFITNWNWLAELLLAWQRGDYRVGLCLLPLTRLSLLTPSFMLLSSMLCYDNSVKPV